MVVWVWEGGSRTSPSPESLLEVPPSDPRPTHLTQSQEEFSRMSMVQRLVVTCLWCLGLSAAIRVDDKDHFRLCNIPQAAQLERVEVTECNRWPCLVRAGQSGTYQITFTQHTNEVIHSLYTNIYAWVKLSLTDNSSDKPIRVLMPGERRISVCRYTQPTCPVLPGVPVTIKKTVTIPHQARMALGQVVVELRVLDEKDRVLVCFKAPVIVA